MKLVKQKKNVLLKMLKLQSKLKNSFIFETIFELFFGFRAAEKARVAAEEAAK